VPLCAESFKWPINQKIQYRGKITWKNSYFRGKPRFCQRRYLILTTARHGEFYRAITLPSVRGMVEDSVIARACGDYGIEFVGPLPD
jgi:hypothetical protein